MKLLHKKAKQGHIDSVQFSCLWATLVVSVVVIRLAAVDPASPLGEHH